ncbi:hypothetical protein VE01_06301 [Pseudogymnoascus verrucosus]|uniref:Rhomboid protease n=1 Tax=Pseudogymnoascus verrucosus TaxID=342668 RepID=A0A1B8GG38_9PEZI|nr:uncharacterized protein VE01_06301 [Pseudogymnoascus verrucosus]OBT94809.1 hypothetical protein VE01_06301 [Pseudogymnoascus verrucosus]
MAIRLNLPPITRGLLLLLLFQSLLSAAVHFQRPTEGLVIPYLTLIPSMSLIYPWTFVTSTFVETNIFSLAISGLTIWHGGRYLERAWTSREFAKFVAMVALVPNVYTFFTLVVMYAITGDVTWSLTPISGTTALQTALLTGLSQLLPTHTITLFRGLLSLRLPRLPLLHLLLVTLLALLPIYTISAPLLSLSGFLTAWAHLRFLRLPLPDLDSPGPLRGDASDAFALAQFFPEPARPSVEAAGDVLAKLGLAPKTPVVVANPSQGGGGGGGGGGQRQGGRAENERRRALALKELDLRLQAATAARAGKGGEASEVKQPEVGEVMKAPEGGEQA